MKKLLFVLIVVTTFQSISQQISFDQTFIGNGFNGDVVVTEQQSDGKILAGGYFSSFYGSPVNGIARLNSNGTLDLTFNPINNSQWQVEHIIIQPDSKILVAGAFVGTQGIVRLNSDGSQDASFDPCTCIDINFYPSIALQSDGKIIVAGGQIPGYIKRLNSNGTLDTSFDPGNGFDHAIISMELQSDGKIIVGGYFDNFNGISQKRIARLNSNGTLDLSFNSGSGISSLSNPTGYVTSISILQSGKILIGGSFDSYNGFSRNRIAQINNDGSLDLSFNPGTGFDGTISDIDIYPNGKILCSGYFSSFNNIVTHDIARLNMDGTIDQLLLNPSNYTFNPGINSINIQPDGKIITGGAGGVGSNGGVCRLIICNEFLSIVNQTLTPVVCESYQSPTDPNVWYDQSGIYYETIYSSSSTCDSIHLTINLTVHSPSFNSIHYDTIYECNTYAWQGQIYSSSGLYSFPLSNQFGCDSTVYLNLTVIPNDNISITPNPTFGTAPLNVAFANQTPNLTNYNFTWYFGDGTSQQSNAPFLSHIYTQNGYADVTVVADNLTTGCSSSQTFNDMIFVIGGVTCTHTAALNQTGPLSGCAGDSLLLSCNTDPSFTYQWNRNGIPVSGATTSSFYPTQSGSYTVTIYQNNCPVTSAGISVTINPIPSVPTITSSGTITPCSGGSMTLTAPSGFTSYLWNTGSTASSLVVSQSGNYSVMVTNNNGCSRTSNPFVVNASFMAAPQVCIVGVDSLTNENRVVWEKPLTQGIDSFYVYKETNVSNVYTKIGATDYNDLAVFLDVNSNPAVQAYRYKISALDTCGVETNVGDFHKTIHLTINQGIGGAWNLIWSHYEGLNFGSYNIYRGTDPSNISLLTTIQSNLNSYSDLTPPTGPLYYQIEVVNPNNCDPTKSLNYGVSRSNIVNNGQIGVNENKVFQFNVYPNPTNGVITLQSAPELMGNSFTILDFMGRILMKDTISNIKQDIDMINFAKGTYYLKIEGALLNIEKLIKN